MQAVTISPPFLSFLEKAIRVPAVFGSGSSDLLGGRQRKQPVYSMFNYENSDLFYWEYRFGSWGTIVTTGQNIFNFEVTMPMNNRKIMDMFLWYSHDFRRNDNVHRAVIELNDKRLCEAGNNVHNDYMSKKRLLIERTYYTYRTMFYRDK